MFSTSQSFLFFYFVQQLETFFTTYLGWWLISNTYDANGFVPGAFLERIDGIQDDMVSARDEEEDGENFELSKTLIS